MIKRIDEFINSLELSGAVSKGSFYLKELNTGDGNIKSLNFKVYVEKIIEGKKFLILTYKPKEGDLEILKEIEGDFVYFVDENYNIGRIPEFEKILDEAIRLKATDIHVEPKSGFMLIRFRIDGDLVTIYQSNQNCENIINKIKVKSGLDTMNKEIQESSFEYKGFMIRVSSVPALNGEKIVYRLLQRSVEGLDLETLGLRKEISEFILNRAQKAGIHLICGPTGSGKNTTLHGIIKKINSDKKNIISIEDPIEYKNENITQLEVNNKRDRTFHKLLRAILRQDPDILYIGEIRDEETAEVAFRSAITGHVVFSTLHTKDINSTFDRILDLNINENLMNEALKTVINQRLVKTLCKDCRKKVEAPKWLKEKGINYVYEAVGCGRCDNGYKGRVGVYEVNVIEDGEVQTIMNFEDSLVEHLKNGKIDLKTFEVENDL